MTTNKYISFDQLLSDLRAENRRNQNLAKPQLSVAQVVGQHGNVAFDDFLPDVRSGRLILPNRPKTDQIEVGSRVTLLSPRRSDSVGEYRSTLMIVLSTDVDSIDGYVFQSAYDSNRRISICRSQVIDCHPPLADDETEVRELVQDYIPF